jgi:two-component system response regulator AtoC
MERGTTLQRNRYDSGMGPGPVVLGAARSGFDDPASLDSKIQEISELQKPQQFLGVPAIIRSGCMLDLYRSVQKIAQTTAAVLITGESGTGKELVARAVHQYSLRCSRPWVDLNCGALPEHLVESELFGYEKGAFSGADGTKPGMFELAHTGTLFLDEVGELEMKTQVKLLRVLDGAAYFRLGGIRKTHADVRIIAATNNNLEEKVRSGRFRADLFHRLTQVQLDVPPLRKRPEDIEALARFFLAQHDSRYYLTDEAIDVLKAYSWPGNIRELRNVVIKSAIFAGATRIGTSDLPASITRPPELPDSAADETICNLERLERKTILRVLSHTGGDQQRAASMLGISRRTLIRKLKLYRMTQSAVVGQPVFAQA